MGFIAGQYQEEPSWWGRHVVSKPGDLEAGRLLTGWMGDVGELDTSEVSRFTVFPSWALNDLVRSGSM